MQTIVYDGSFAGLLTAIFDVYEYKCAQPDIQPIARRQDTFFSAAHEVHTDKTKAARVWDGLKKKLSAQAMKQLYHTYLGEEQGMENRMLQYVQHVFVNAISIETDHVHPAVKYVTEMAGKVHREKHRMEAFVRFKQTHGNLYYAVVEPDFNVLPLIADHFEKRYADQQWLIYDLRRKYGIYYDLRLVQSVEVDFNELTVKTDSTVAIFESREHIYQQLWQLYFTNTNIKARKNMKLHIRHMPKRYWKYLVEKGVRL